MEQIESKTTNASSKQISVKRTLNYRKEYSTQTLSITLKLLKLFFHSIFSQFRQSVTPVRDSYWHAKPTRSLALTIRTHTRKGQISSPLSVKKKNAPAIRNSSSASLYSTTAPAPPSALPDLPSWKWKKLQRATASLIACRYVITQTRLNVPATRPERKNFEH